MFAAAEHGKPYLVGYDLAFNLSHSASTAYLVLGGTEPIGIDVELPHVIEDLMSVARSVFSHREIGEIESATEEARAGLFLRCWTRKEAYVKALGVGLGARLSDITVGSAREDVVVPATFGISEKSFHVRTLEAPFGEHAAIATMSPPAGVAVRDFRLT